MIRKKNRLLVATILVWVLSINQMLEATLHADPTKTDIQNPEVSVTPSSDKTLSLKAAAPNPLTTTIAQSTIFYNSTSMTVKNVNGNGKDVTLPLNASTGNTIATTINNAIFNPTGIGATMGSLLSTAFGSATSKLTMLETQIGNDLANNVSNPFYSALLQSIPLSTIPKLRATNIAKLVAYLSPQQIQALTLIQIQALTTAQIATLTPAQIIALTLNQTAALSPQQLTAIKAQYLTPSQKYSVPTNPISYTSGKTMGIGNLNSSSASSLQPIKVDFSSVRFSSISGPIILPSSTGSTTSGSIGQTIANLIMKNNTTAPSEHAAIIGTIIQNAIILGLPSPLLSTIIQTGFASSINNLSPSDQQVLAPYLTVQPTASSSTAPNTANTFILASPDSLQNPFYANMTLPYNPGSFYLLNTCSYNPASATLTLSDNTTISSAQITDALLNSSSTELTPVVMNNIKAALQLANFDSSSIQSTTSPMKSLIVQTRITTTSGKSFYVFFNSTNMLIKNFDGKNNDVPVVYSSISTPLSIASISNAITNNLGAAQTSGSGNVTPVATALYNALTGTVPQTTNNFSTLLNFMCPALNIPVPTQTRPTVTSFAPSNISYSAATPKIMTITFNGSPTPIDFSQIQFGSIAGPINANLFGFSPSSIGATISSLVYSKINSRSVITGSAASNTADLVGALIQNAIVLGVVSPLLTSIVQTGFASSINSLSQSDQQVLAPYQVSARYLKSMPSASSNPQSSTGNQLLINIPNTPGGNPQALTFAAFPISLTTNGLQTLLALSNLDNSGTTINCSSNMFATPPSLATMPATLTSGLTLAYYQNLLAQEQTPSSTASATASNNASYIAQAITDALTLTAGTTSPSTLFATQTLMQFLMQSSFLQQQKTVSYALASFDAPSKIAPYLFPATFTSGTTSIPFNNFAMNIQGTVLPFASLTKTTLPQSLSNLLNTSNPQANSLAQVLQSGISKSLEISNIIPNQPSTTLTYDANGLTIKNMYPGTPYPNVYVSYANLSTTLNQYLNTNLSFTAAFELALYSALFYGSQYANGSNADEQIKKDINDLTKATATALTGSATGDSTNLNLSYFIPPAKAVRQGQLSVQQQPANNSPLYCPPAGNIPAGSKVATLYEINGAGAIVLTYPNANLESWITTDQNNDMQSFLTSLSTFLVNNSADSSTTSAQPVLVNLDDATIINNLYQVGLASTTSKSWPIIKTEKPSENKPQDFFSGNRTLRGGGTSLFTSRVPETTPLWQVWQAEAKAAASGPTVNRGNKPVRLAPPFAAVGDLGKTPVGPANAVAARSVTGTSLYNKLDRDLPHIYDQPKPPAQAPDVPPAKPHAPYDHLQRPPALPPKPGTKTIVIVNEEIHAAPQARFKVASAYQAVVDFAPCQTKCVYDPSSKPPKSTPITILDSKGVPTGALNAVEASTINNALATGRTTQSISSATHASSLVADLSTISKVATAARTIGSTALFLLNNPVTFVAGILLEIVSTAFIFYQMFAPNPAILVSNTFSYDFYAVARHGFPDNGANASIVSQALTKLLLTPSTNTTIKNGIFQNIFQNIAFPQANINNLPTSIYNQISTYLSPTQQQQRTSYLALPIPNQLSITLPATPSLYPPLYDSPYNIGYDNDTMYIAGLCMDVAANLIVAVPFTHIAAALVPDSTLVSQQGLWAPFVTSTLPPTSFQLDSTRENFIPTAGSIVYPLSKLSSTGDLTITPTVSSFYVPIDTPIGMTYMSNDLMYNPANASAQAIVAGIVNNLPSSIIDDFGDSRSPLTPLTCMRIVELANYIVGGTSDVSGLYNTIFPVRSLFNENAPLTMGSRQSAVKDLQDFLSLIDIPVVNQDEPGMFGNDTHQAIRQFQKDHHLQADGIFAGATAKKANAIISHATRNNAKGVLKPFHKNTLLKRNAVDRNVEKLKNFLTHQGYADAYGTFGPATQEGVRLFQQLNKLSPDGKFAGKTISLANSILAKQ